MKIEVNLEGEQTRRAALVLNLTMGACVALYCAFGARMFQYFEYDHRYALIESELEAIKSCFVQHTSRWNKDEFPATNLSVILLEVCTKEYLSLDQWDFLDAIVYAFTTVVTVGYDAIEPRTNGGRMFSVCFTIIGIPFTMVLIGNFGKFLHEGAEALYIAVRKRLKNRTKDRQKQRKASIPDRENGPMPTSNSYQSRMMLIGQDEESGTLKPITQQKQNASGATQVEEVEEEEEDDDEEAPFFRVMLLMVLAYVITGTIMWPIIDGLLLIPAIYYSVMTVTALDFDMIFRGEWYYVPVKLTYAIVGLALVTVAIDVGSEYLRKLHFIGKKVDFANETIWVGGKKVKMKNMVTAVCKQSGVTADKIQNLDMNFLMKAAVAQEDGNPLPDPVEEEEIEMEDPADAKQKIRHIDSTDVDTDHGGRDPPPPPPPTSSYLVDESMADAGGSADGRGQGGSSNLSATHPGTGYSPSTGYVAQLNAIHEDDWSDTSSNRSCTQTPEPKSITDTGIDTYSEADSCDANGRMSPFDNMADASNMCQPPIGTPLIQNYLWNPDAPGTSKQGLIGLDWKPSPPKLREKIVSDLWAISPPPGASSRRRESKRSVHFDVEWQEVSIAQASSTESVSFQIPDRPSSARSPKRSPRISSHLRRDQTYPLTPKSTITHNTTPIDDYETMPNSQSSHSLLSNALSLIRHELKSALPNTSYSRLQEQEMHVYKVHAAPTCVELNMQRQSTPPLIQVAVLDVEKLSTPGPLETAEFDLVTTHNKEEIHNSMTVADIFKPLNIRKNQTSHGELLDDDQHEKPSIIQVAADHELELIDKPRVRYADLITFIDEPENADFLFIQVEDETLPNVTATYRALNEPFYDNQMSATEFFTCAIQEIVYAPSNTNVDISTSHKLENIIFKCDDFFTAEIHYDLLLNDAPSPITEYSDDIDQPITTLDDFFTSEVKDTTLPLIVPLIVNDCSDDISIPLSTVDGFFTVLSHDIIEALQSPRTFDADILDFDESRSTPDDFFTTICDDTVVRLSEVRTQSFTEFIQCNPSSVNDYFVPLLEHDFASISVRTSIADTETIVGTHKISDILFNMLPENMAPILHPFTEVSESSIEKYEKHDSDLLPMKMVIDNHIPVLEQAVTYTEIVDIVAPVSTVDRYHTAIVTELKDSLIRPHMQLARKITVNTNVPITVDNFVFPGITEHLTSLDLTTFICFSEELSPIISPMQIKLIFQPQEEQLLPLDDFVQLKSQLADVSIDEQAYIILPIKSLEETVRAVSLPATYCSSIDYIDYILSNCDAYGVESSPEPETMSIDGSEDGMMIERVLKNKLRKRRASSRRIRLAKPQLVLPMEGRSFADIMKMNREKTDTKGMVLMLPQPPGRSGYVTSVEIRHAIYQAEWEKLKIRSLNLRQNRKRKSTSVDTSAPNSDSPGRPRKRPLSAQTTPPRSAESRSASRSVSRKTSGASTSRASPRTDDSPLDMNRNRTATGTPTSKASLRRSAFSKSTRDESIESNVSSVSATSPMSRGSSVPRRGQAPSAKRAVR